MRASATRWQDAAAAAIAAALDATSLQSRRWTACGGSSLNETWRLDAGGARYFVKVNGLARQSMLEAEADGLAALARTGVLRVPAPVAHGVADDVAFLVLEWLDFTGGGRDAALGHALAQLHRVTGHEYGWHRNNTIGTTPQRNAWANNWATFFRDRRIASQLVLAADNGHGGRLQRDGERLLVAIPALLAGHAPAPSLLHGDLWSGNAARLATGEPVLFDPAVYYGDREADLAMTELFGGFGADFDAAYREAWPVDAAYSIRRTLYNLYHVLNHLNLFGGGYRGQAEAMIGHLNAEAS
jgi:protein-ribulosamine 3-kinase